MALVEGPGSSSLRKEEKKEQESEGESGVFVDEKMCW